MDSSAAAPREGFYSDADSPVGKVGTGGVAASYRTSDARSRSSNATHCLQSIEKTGAAQREGFAHFFASRVWNEQDGGACTFPYYKEFLETEGGVAVSPPVPIDCAGVRKWRNNYCSMGPSARGPRRFRYGESTARDTRWCLPHVGGAGEDGRSPLRALE
jgi:hypothetical protein